VSTLLEVKNLTKSYSESLFAVKDVSFHIAEGECLGLVGGSGSGKSTLARLILALEKPDQGEIQLLGLPIYKMRGKLLRQARRHVQVVFQDPTASLNSRLPIWKSVIEPLDNYPDVQPLYLKDVRNNRRLMAGKLLELVGLGRELGDKYPHQLSGGQKQRVAIARGLSLQPKLLICDETTASLDVSVQAQILNLLKDMQETLGIAYLFISHDLSAVRFMCNRIAVMKDGCIVEQFHSSDLLQQERHPYTQQLIEAVM
jgi:ABC-type oligopeptide transport system ATPase subunit